MHSQHTLVIVFKDNLTHESFTGHSHDICVLLGGSVIIIDPAMGLERCDYCIASAKPSVWIWMKGSKFKYLKVLYFPPAGTINLRGLFCLKFSLLPDSYNVSYYKRFTFLCTCTYNYTVHTLYNVFTNSSCSP